MKKREYVRFAVCLLATLFASCSGDDLLDDVQVEMPRQAAPFQWTRAEDVETRHEFLRNFGVGYSYDAVRGSYCDWQDIRCQVLNRAVLLALQDETGDNLLRTDQSQSVHTESTFQYSYRDYVVNMDMSTKAEVNLGLYKSGGRRKQHFIEDGVKEYYYYLLSEKISLAHQFVGWANVMAFYDDEESVFTESFRNAVKHIDESRIYDFAAVDSFVNVWGTHVIVEAWLGGVLHVDLKNDMWRWTDMARDSAWTSTEFLGAVASKEERRQSSTEFNWMENARLSILARGGDQSSLTGLLGEHQYDGTRTFSIDGIAVWRNSLMYDPDDELHSNAEMVDMNVIPIWEFAALISETAATRIQIAITQDISLMRKLLGDRNFFDARFPIRYNSLSCQWRKNTGTWQQATRTDSDGERMVVNIMSGGRYVATVCHETINNRDLWVCYPIYEGRMKEACGLGVDKDNKVYQVRWLGGVAKMTRLEDDTADQYFYINGGGVSVSPVDGIEYPAYEAIPYIELSGGVRPDGSYAGEAYNVTKDGTKFQLLAPGGKTDIVGFTDTYNTSGSNHIYKRNDNYVYIYNQNEIKK